MLVMLVIDDFLSSLLYRYEREESTRMRLRMRMRGHRFGFRNLGVILESGRAREFNSEGPDSRLSIIRRTAGLHHGERMELCSAYETIGHERMPRWGISGSRQDQLFNRA